ncbi:hypothetical protein BOTBODRAFT_26614 [Botryobasidium botryosum FD-172 SS1]|uniref:Uncharacterized protein n=1 Tax=Botryobasidium botryosum (strain FD-172 SS1) TaxID=930990 RepID=A0A067N902_BOTB1|nr:hypothetical protein BOTBODRAFT_26614 [Botryobasidium botryosum FD-172 SS1]
MSAPLRRTLWQTWYATEAIPIYVVVGAAVGGAGWYLSRLARGPDVIWDRKNNPTPWNHVEQNTNTKLMSHKHEFEKSWSRDRL